MTADRTILPCLNTSYSDLLLPFTANDAIAVIKSTDGIRNIQIGSYLKPDGKIDMSNK
ncbi:MAG: hypothetical protein PHX86_06365 [Caldisericia bacterium]|nr:hypothetical protein [Bacteroidales bacterium]MDD4029311.1 hypothetical protein [Caldisericia bacterium]